MDWFRKDKDLRFLMYVTGLRITFPDISAYQDSSPARISSPSQGGTRSVPDFELLTATRLKTLVPR